MNIAFWMLIGIGAALLWLALIFLFRPLGKLIGMLFKHIDFIINGEDEDNDIDELPTVREVDELETLYHNMREEDND